MNSRRVGDSFPPITRRAFIYSALAAGGCSAVAAYAMFKGFLPLSNGHLRRTLLFYTRQIRHPLEHGWMGTRAGWQKYARNPVLGGPLGICFDVSVLKEGGRYRMWFSWRPRRSIGVTESPDGIAWSPPAIALWPELSWELLVNRPCVLRVSNGYEMWYTGQTGRYSLIGHAVSADGIKWQRTSARPVLVPDQTWERTSVMCPHVIWDGATRQYRMWYSAGGQFEPKAIGYATSSDGRSWVKRYGPVFTHGAPDDFDCSRVAGCYVLQHNGWHVMFYAGYSDVADSAIGLARSRDGITGWERHPANPIIGPSEHFTDWDSGSVYKPSVVLDGSGWMLWYNASRLYFEQIGLATHHDLNLGFESP